MASTSENVNTPEKILLKSSDNETFEVELAIAM
ncbi:hypothetical protein A2U01_0090349, partial [Trifolium medium]|nr:hypothetical protein [Trifolium medium]